MILKPEIFLKLYGSPDAEVVMMNSNPATDRADTGIELPNLCHFEFRGLALASTSPAVTIP